MVILDSNSKGPVDLMICGAKGRESIPKLGKRNSPRRPEIPPTGKMTLVCTVSQTNPKIVWVRSFPPPTSHNSKTLNRHRLIQTIQTVLEYFDQKQKVANHKTTVFDLAGSEGLNAVRNKPTFQSNVVSNWKGLLDTFAWMFTKHEPFQCVWTLWLVIERLFNSAMTC